MPFNTTEAPPSTTPRITIAFSGLIVLQPGPNNTCSIGVNKLDRNHQFQAVLIVHQPNRPPIAIPLLMGPLTASFSIGLDPDPNPELGDFMVFAKDPFDRTPRSHELDFRWAINFKDLHLNVSANEGVEPLGNLKTGVLYTPSLTDPSLNPRLTRAGSTDFQLNQIAANLAASITLREGTKLLFNWRDQGDSVDLLLPREGDHDDTVYTIHFLNEPPNLNVDPHDEFALYYRVLKSGGTSIPGAQRFELEVDDGPTRTDQIPCMPVTLNP